MSNNKINEGKVVPVKIPQPPVKRMQDGKVVAAKVPRPTPAPSKKWLWLNKPCGEPQGTVAGDKGWGDEDGESGEVQ